MSISLTAWLWAGLLLGVSFIATPAKFLAPSISLPEALDVGRSTYSVLKWVELTGAFALLFAIVKNHSTVISWSFFALLTALLATQYFYLLPLLDDRVALIIDNISIAPSNLHQFYVGVEVAKVGLLISLGVLAFRSWKGVIT